MLRSRIGCLSSRLLHWITAQVGSPVVFALDDESIRQELVHAAYLDTGDPILQEGWESGLVNGTNACQKVHIMPVFDVLDGICTRESTPQSHFQILVGTQSGPASTAEGLLPNGILGHVVKMIANAAQNIARLFKETHGPGRIAGIMEGDFAVIISAWIELKLVVLDEIGREFANVYHFCGTGIFKTGTRNG